MGRRARRSPGSTPTSWPARSRSRSARSARRWACRTAPPASPSPRPSRGASSSASRSRAGWVAAGPAGTAYLAIGDHWRWFGRVVAERKVREGDPIVVVLERTLRRRGRAPLAQHPADAELVRLRDWLSTFLIFVRLFDRAVGLVSRLEPTELERAVRLLGEVPDDTILRLVTLLDGLPDEDVLGLVEALSRLSPASRPPRDDADVGVVRTLVR